ncbi:hypothetical protein RND81_09G095900 [Saponaria officinalis]|uniref:Vacuolar ATPase assembly integral membrane protein VMA21 homolog n=1 Tax=Saponaria officinalis TaxID=3572 RepID=A0AAW1IIS7_SAPOF
MVSATMAGVPRKFFIASMFMWTLPIAILYGFQHAWFPGFSHISPYSLNLLSGLLAVVSVNVMLGFYIWMAMKEPTGKHTPNPAFVAKARASMKPTPKATGGRKED